MKTYDPSGESTLPLVPKKRKVEAEEEEEETKVPVKAKKSKIVEIKGLFLTQSFGASDPFLCGLLNLENCCTVP